MDKGRVDDQFVLSLVSSNVTHKEALVDKISILNVLFIVGYCRVFNAFVCK
jgi:hypothetical protein